MAAPWLPESAGGILGWDWAGGNPEAGIAKIDPVTSPKAQKSATESLLSGWADNDFRSLSFWLNGNREHPIFDQAAYHLGWSRLPQKSGPIRSGMPTCVKAQPNWIGLILLRTDNSTLRPARSQRSSLHD